MFEIKWIITDNLSGISANEFDNEWNGIISGFFELSINDYQEGVYPHREINAQEEGLEDVLYWLIHLLEGIIAIKEGKEYEMLLMTENLYKLVLWVDDNVVICCMDRKDNTVKWKEEVSLQKFETKICESVDVFLSFVNNKNAELMESRWIKKLYLYRQMLYN